TDHRLFADDDGGPYRGRCDCAVPGADADPGNDPGLRPQDHRHLHNHAADAAIPWRDHGCLYGSRGRYDYRRRLTVILDLAWAPAAAFSYMLLFARIGVMLMLMPALGEQTLPARMRLGFALTFTFVLYPLLAETLPAAPNSVGGL